VEGYALAGGCEIALACDLIVAAEDAQFGIPEVRRGLMAGSGGLIRLPQRIPRQIAMEYALTGAMLPAAEARQWGLVNRITASGQALAKATRTATESGEAATRLTSGTGAADSLPPPGGGSGGFGGGGAAPARRTSSRRTSNLRSAFGGIAALVLRPQAMHDETKARATAALVAVLLVAFERAETRRP
jgi:enoyl-CoA hydratase/carnithine racemase